MSLTELEKVAIFFVALGPERAEGLLKRLGTDAMMQVAGAIKRLGPVSPEMKRAVLREMLDLLSGRPPGGGNRLRAGYAAPGGEEDLMGRVSDLFDRDVDVRNLNWEAAGLDFGAPPPKPPDEDSDEPPPRFRR